MENFNEEIFGFGTNTNEELEQTNNFNYDSISGLGQSDYENEDLFTDNYTIDTSYNSFSEENNSFDIPFLQQYNFETKETINDNQNTTDDFEEVFVEQMPEVTETSSYDENTVQISPIVPEISDYEDQTVVEEKSEPVVPFETVPSVDPTLQEQEAQTVEEESEPVVSFEEVLPVETVFIEQDDQTVVEETPNDEVEESTPVTFSETPIDELKKLTEYEEEKIEKTDINTLFDKVSVNFKDASDIFRKNTDLKAKIDTRFEELKKLQSEIENSRKNQLDEINKYKEEVVAKLTEKKEEIEKRLNLLKESQAALEKEKKEFDLYRKKEQENIDKVQKEVQSAYDDRREELGHIEDVLRKQKDALDEERSQLSLDRIQYESDKNELANNLLKFNELVNSFTNGVNNIKE